MATKSQCAICLESFPLDGLQWIPCGHGFCSQCLTKYIENAPPQNTKLSCPYCRKRFGRDKPHRIIVVQTETQSQLASDADECYAGSGSSNPSCYSDTMLKKASFVAERIKQMGPASAALSVHRAGLEIKKVANGIGATAGDSVQTLLDAVAEFFGRISPVFSKLVEQEGKLQAFEQDKKQLIDDLQLCQDEKQQAEHLVSQAIETAEQATRQKCAAEEENERLRKRNQDILREQDELIQKHREDCAALYRTLAGHKDKEAKQKTKIKALRDELHNQKTAIETLNLNSATGTRETTPSMTAGDVVLGDEESQEYQSAGTPVFPDDFQFDDFSGPPACPSNLSDNMPAPLQRRPTFGTSWTLPAANTKKRKSRSAQDPNAAQFQQTLNLDRRGNPKGNLQLGSRQRLKF